MPQRQPRLSKLSSSDWSSLCEARRFWHRTGAQVFKRNGGSKNKDTLVTSEICSLIMRASWGADGLYAGYEETLGGPDDFIGAFSLFFWVYVRRRGVVSRVWGVDLGVNSSKRSLVSSGCEEGDPIFGVHFLVLAGQSPGSRTWQFPQIRGPQRRPFNAIILILWDPYTVKPSSWGIPQLAFTISGNLKPQSAKPSSISPYTRIHRTNI